MLTRWTVSWAGLVHAAYAAPSSEHVNVAPLSEAANPTGTERDFAIPPGMLVVIEVSGGVTSGSTANETSSMVRLV